SGEEDGNAQADQYHEIGGVHGDSPCAVSIRRHQVQIQGNGEKDQGRCVGVPVFLEQTHQKRA
ncbi:MAG: hypothetical protein LBT40_11445, partial [Deltaproteobacteria bacterium]|nr:hypothetical protein [Deltaproteobacteria bacterium]